MKKAVITILGTIGGYCKDDRGIYNEQIQEALYKSEIEDIKETKDKNSLPILIKTYSKEYDIIPIHTTCAKDIQQQVLKNSNDETVTKFEIKDEYKIKDDQNYDETFRQIDDIISSYDKVIVDVSHGYRHLPILMIVNVIMQNIENINKIEKIIFAKELEKNKIYQFIDLKRYLDLANITYALTTFDRNYTVANNMKVNDHALNDFLNDLSKFSKHILANSLDELLTNSNKKKSVTTKLINQINNILENENENFVSLNRLLKKSLEHLKDIEKLKDKIDYEKLYYLSENMYKKGYLLNSITLLSEAVGMYCTARLKDISPEIADFINEYEEKANLEKNNPRNYFKIYTLYNQSKVFYTSKVYRGIFLNVEVTSKKSEVKQKLKKWNQGAEKITELIKKELQEDNELKILIRNIDQIRNNLAHANSSKRLTDVEDEIKKVLDDFQQMISNI